MKTIGAKELRLHLDQIFDRVLDGEEIIVNHRFKGPIRLTTVSNDSAKSPTKLAGLRAFDAAPKKKNPFDPTKTIKELYHNSLNKKYGR